MEQNIISVDDVAKFNNVKRITVQTWMRKGLRIPGVKKYFKSGKGPTCAYIITPSAEYFKRKNV